MAGVELGDDGGEREKKLTPKLISKSTTINSRTATTFFSLLPPHSASPARIICGSFFWPGRPILIERDPQNGTRTKTKATSRCRTTGKTTTMTMTRRRWIEMGMQMGLRWSGGQARGARAEDNLNQRIWRDATPRLSPPATTIFTPPPPRPRRRSASLRPSPPCAPSSARPANAGAGFAVAPWAYGIRCRKKRRGAQSQRPCFDVLLSVPELREESAQVSLLNFNTGFALRKILGARTLSRPPGLMRLEVVFLPPHTTRLC
ncbi:hypothetical protein K438DRAFT_1773142 [Mycena galopus ATCC 62051]|nr:hypothetical protein K438DRAFT_1773142 [Mycena galopus ATCC 62051]